MENQLKINSNNSLRLSVLVVLLGLLGTSELIHNFDLIFLLNRGDHSAESNFYDFWHTHSNRGYYIGLVKLSLISIGLAFWYFWHKRANRNLRSLEMPGTWPDKEILPTWFVPIVNLHRPLRFVKDMMMVYAKALFRFRSLITNKSVSEGAFIKLWDYLWFCWIFGIVTLIADFMLISWGPLDREDLVFFFVLSILRSAGDIGIGFLGILFTLKAMRAERQLYQLWLAGVFEDLSFENWGPVKGQGIAAWYRSPEEGEITMDDDGTFRDQEP